MKVIKPVAFVKATHLLDSNAGEPIATWSGGTTYAASTESSPVKVFYLDRIYESLQGANQNKLPTTNPTYWLDIGPGNVVAMFDTQVSTTTTKTTSSLPLIVTLSTGSINSVALVNVSGSTSVSFHAESDGVTVYDGTVDMANTFIGDWYEYFFNDFDELSVALKTDLPPYPDMTLTITVYGSSSVSVGACVFGTVIDLGLTRVGPKVGIIDYSKKETDTYGTTTFVQRAFARKASISAFVDNSRLNRITGALSALRATPTIWIGSELADLSETLVIYGFARDWSVDIAYPQQSLCTLEIEGLT